MLQQVINVGAAAGDGTGDKLRTGGRKINDNFAELYAQLVPATLVETIAPQLAAYIDGITKGDPGGNAMAIGAFEAASGLNIPLGTDAVRTNGHLVLQPGKGIADYVADGAVDAAYVAAHPHTSFMSANGRGFRFAGPCIDLFQAGAAGDNFIDDKAALAAAVASGKPFIIPGEATFRCTGSVPVGSNAHGYGHGTINFDSAGGANRLFSVAGNVSNVRFENIGFTSTSDVGFTNIFRLDQQAGEVLDGLWIVDCRMLYAPPAVGAGDRWFIAGAGPGTRQNIHILRNRVEGPMQLTASLVQSGKLKDCEIRFNWIKNAKTNAISLSATGGLGTVGTLDTVFVTDNYIEATLYTSIGIFVGIDGNVNDQNSNLANLFLARNTIKIVGSPAFTADVYIHLGNFCATIGGFDSANDNILLDDNDLYGGWAIVRNGSSNPATIGFAPITKFIYQSNRLYAGEALFRDLADGAIFQNNIHKPGASVRPGEGNGRIVSNDNKYATLSTKSGDAEFTWLHRGDTYTGAASVTDRVVQLNCNAGKNQVFDVEGGAIDSFSTGTRRAAIYTLGAGGPVVSVRNLSSSTAWTLGRYERTATGGGGITDYTGGEIFLQGGIDPANLTVGTADVERTITNVFGAVLGDTVDLSFSNDLLGLQIIGRVSAADTIKYYFQNPNGNPNGTVNLGTGTVRARFFSKAA